MANNNNNNNNNNDAVQQKSSSLDDTTIDTSTAGQTSFVDYVPPPDVKIKPPAKYKLWLMIFVLVYLAEWFAEEAEYLSFLRFRGQLSPNTSLFLMLGSTVFVLVYSTLDLWVELCTFKAKDSGKIYGVGAWLKAPRVEWVYKYDNFLAQCLAGIITILEEGFEMFDAPPQSMPSKKKIQRSEFHCDSSNCETVLKIQHVINSEKMKEYRKWVSRIRKAVGNAPGYKKTESIDIPSPDENDNNDNNHGPTLFTHDVEAQIENVTKIERAMSNDDIIYNSSDNGHVQIVYLTFANIDFLNEWMLSPKRKALMQQLEPLLMVPDILQVQNDRKLPDAFTDLLTQQGQAVPNLQPKKWKVWWLTTVALYITVRWTAAFMPYYYDQWGISDNDDAHPRVRAAVGILISTFLNSYVSTPLLLFIFNHWVQRKECEIENCEPWRTLNDGIQSMGLKTLVTILFYGGCVVAWLVKKHTEL